MPVLRRLLLLFCLLPWLPVGVLAQDSGEEAVRQAVDAFLRVQVRNLPGRASYLIDTINTRALPPCGRFNVSPTPGASAWGRSSVTVRCAAGANWSLIVPVRIQVFGDYLVTARSIGFGQTIGAADIATQSGDLGELPAGILNDSSQAIGQVARAAIAAGKPLRADLLRAPHVIQQGQNVKVVSRGNGFEVSGEGRALANASLGQVVQVRLGNGQVVSGIAEAGGSVDISN
jgi:flagella basal body P-ring formation protein FlgA